MVVQRRYNIATRRGPDEDVDDVDDVDVLSPRVLEEEEQEGDEEEEEGTRRHVLHQCVCRSLTYVHSTRVLLLHLLELIPIHKQHQHSHANVPAPAQPHIACAQAAPAPRP